MQTLLDIDGHGNLKANLLIALLPLVSEAERPTLVATAIAAAREIGPKIRRGTLTAVLPHVPDAERDLLINEVLGPNPNVWTLCAIARYLPPQLLASAVDHAFTLKTEFRRTQAFEALAPWLPAALLNQALRSLSNFSLDTPEDRERRLPIWSTAFPPGSRRLPSRSWPRCTIPTCGPPC